MSTIQVRDLTKRYGSVTAIDHLSFEISAGRVTGFLGANGSGKTTTLRCLVGLVTPTGGSATINRRRYRDLADPVHTVGVAISSDTFHPGRTAVAHLEILATAAGIGRDRVEVVLSLVGLTEVARRRVGRFSMGMRQRLALASALLGDPEVLILDEPLNGLDPDGITWLRIFLRHLAGEGRTVFLSSHLLSEVAQTVDDVVVIDHGRLLVADHLEALSNHHLTVIRTPDPVALIAALGASGIAAHQTGSDRVEAPGSTGKAVGLVAARHGLVVTALTEQQRRPRVLVPPVDPQPGGGEDAVFFPALEAKVGPERMARDELDAQHHGLDKATMAVRQALDALGHDRTEFATAKLRSVDAVEDLGARVAEHLDLEELIALPLYQAEVSVAEHQALEAKVQTMDPFEQLFFTVPWLFDRLPAPIREGALAAAPEVFRVVYAGHIQEYRRLVQPLGVRTR